MNVPIVAPARPCSTCAHFVSLRMQNGEGVCKMAGTYNSDSGKISFDLAVHARKYGECRPTGRFWTQFTWKDDVFYEVKP